MWIACAEKPHLEVTLIYLSWSSQDSDLKARIVYPSITIPPSRN